MFQYGCVNLSDWAERVGVSKFIAYRWFREGTLPVPAQKVGRLILVDMESSESLGGRTVLYARVSSHDQRGDLDRQVARLTEWATRRGLSVDEVVTEVGSAMNAKRRKLARVLLTRRRSPSWSSTATVSPASGQNTSKPPFRREAAGVGRRRGRGL